MEAALSPPRRNREARSRGPAAPGPAPLSLLPKADASLRALGDAAFLQFDFAAARTLWALASRNGGRNGPAERPASPSPDPNQRSLRAACLVDFHEAVREELAAGDLWMTPEAQAKLRALLDVWPQFFPARCLLAAAMYLQDGNVAADEEMHRASIDCAGWTLGREQLITERSWPNPTSREETLALLATWWPDEPLFSYVLGMWCLLDGDAPNAITSLRQGQRRAPHADNVIFGLAQAYARAEQWSAAEELYGQLVELAPRTDSFRYLRGQAQHALGRVEDALHTWTELAAISPSRSHLTMLAQMYEEAGDVDAALRFYGEWLQRDPRDTQTLAAMGYLHAHAGRPADALELYRRALAHEPQDVALQLNLGMTLRSLGELGEAADICARARAQAEQEARTHYCLGLCFGDLGQSLEAEACFRVALRLDPADSDALETLLALLIAQEKYQAIPELMACVKLTRPEDASLWARAAATAYVTGELPNFWAWLERALDLDADCASAWRLMSMAAAATGDTEAELRARRRLIDLDAACPSDYVYLAQGLRSTGRAQEALAFAAMGVQCAAPDDAASVEALQELAFCHRDVGNVHAAAAALQLAHALDPDDVAVLSALGEVRLCLGDVDAAKRAFDEVLVVDPQNAQCLLNLALLELRAVSP